MTDDLVKRLRGLADCDARSGEPLGECMREAADRIEELQDTISRIQYTNLRRDINLAERTKGIDKLCKRSRQAMQNKMSGSLRLICECGGVYEVCTLPMDVERLAAEVAKAKCTICDKGSKHACIYVEKNSSEVGGKGGTP